MSVLIVDGPASLEGSVRVSGAKNSATRLLAAALLAEQQVELHNFPTELLDVHEQVRFMRSLGANVVLDKEGEKARIMVDGLATAPLARYDHRIRITYLLVAGQLMRGGIARIPYPGGCRFGERKHDLHIMIWERMGATVAEVEEHIEIRCRRLRGTEIDFPILTVGGTENALLCGSIAEGVTTIRNAYITAEVAHLIAFLRVLGADVEVVGRSLIRVVGRPGLAGAVYRVMPDRMEAITWAIAAAVTRGHILIHDVPMAELAVPFVHLRAAGIDFFKSHRDLFICDTCISEGGIQPFEVACGTDPGVHTDMQPFFVLLAMCANGNSRVVDYRYPDRIGYLVELRKLCCDPQRLVWERGNIHIRGPVPLRGAEMTTTDLRGTMAMIIGAVAATGKSHIIGWEAALRGYNRLQEKLQGLGLPVEAQPAARAAE